MAVNVQIGPDGQALLNSSFSAACHPLICTIGDGVLSELRGICRGSRGAADAGRKRLQVFLPASPSELPQPEDLRSLLSRLPALAHLTIVQDNAPSNLLAATTSPSLPTRPAAHHPQAPCATSPLAAYSQHNAGAAQSPRCRLRRPPPPPCLPWRTALTSLRPQHLRSLELHGLVVRLPTHGSARRISAAAAPSLAADGDDGAAADAATPPAGRQDLRPKGRSPSTLELLSRVLLAAPGLQELSLLGVTALPEDDEQDETEGANEALGAREASDGCDDGGGGAAGWCAVLCALPPALTALRLGLRPPPPSPPGAVGPRDPQPCAACLGDALCRLPRLSVLELSGVRADVALAALQRAAPPPTDAMAPPASPPPPPPQHHQPRSRPQHHQQQEQQPQQRRQGQVPPSCPALPHLERLVLDVEGHLAMAGLRAVLATGLARLRHLTVVERRVQAHEAQEAEPAPAPAAAAVAAARRGGLGGSRGAGACGGGGEAEPGGDGVQEDEEEEEQQQFSPLGSVLWMLRRPELRRLSFTTDRSFTALEQSSQPPSSPPPQLAPPRPEAAMADGGGSADGDDGAGGSCLSCVRLSLDLSAEALEPLVSSLPPSLTSLTLNVGTLHRPSDVMAAYAATRSCRLASGGSGGSAAAAAPPPAAAAADSPAWLSVPPHSFLGGLRFVWPALTALPRLLPGLRELRLGGGAAAGCSDHVLRCWAGASRHPDSLATPMVVDPSFNAMVRHQLPPTASPPPPPVSFFGSGVGEEDGYGQPGSWAAVTPAAAGISGGAGAAAAGAAAMGWSDWARSLERVCLMGAGPTVAGALHLRRFMGGLRRLQVVVDGRLTDVVVAHQGA